MGESWPFRGPGLEETVDVAMETERVQRDWDEAAILWDEFVETGLDFARLEVHGPALSRACGSVKGLNVLDIGCGQGYFSRVLAKGGAKVVGIDLSPRMIAIARAHEKGRPLGVQYRVMDARRIDKVWASGTFDLVTACMSLQDMPAPGRVIHSTSEVLSDHGAMAFSVVHPVNNSWGKWERKDGKRGVWIADYFRHGRYIVPWDMPRLRNHWSTVSYNFTISDWSAMIEDSGLLIQRICEPRPTKSQVKRHPELEACSRIPFFLVYKLLRK